MPVIASIILLDLIVAAVGGGSLILARRLRPLLHISAASPFALRYLRGLSALPCLPANQQASKAANQEACTYCGPQKLN